MSQKLISKNFNGWETLVNKDVGYAPYLSSTLRHRIKKKKATNIVITGEPGEGKSYFATDICRVLQGLTESNNDRFSLDQVVFTYKHYLDLIIHLKMGDPIIFDEPSYAMGKRDWYKELNKALVQTIESQRFKVHPLFIPIINKSLLDKTIRSYLIQYQIHVRDRGKAIVYRIFPSQHTDEVYRYTFCDLDYDLFDMHLCKKDSCLGCETLLSCNIFRARYERKKASIQDVRYERAYDEASVRESKEMTDEELAHIVVEQMPKDIPIKPQTIRIYLLTEHGVKLGINRAGFIAQLALKERSSESTIAG